MPGTGVMLRSDFTEGMKATAYDYFLDAKEYQKIPSFYKSVCQVKTSDKAYEQATSVVEASDPVERGEFDDMTAMKATEGYTTYAKIRQFYKAAHVSKRAMRDHQKLKNWIKEITSGWSVDMERGKNKYVAKFINNGGLTAGYSIFNNSITGVLTDPAGDLCYDGKPLFNLNGNNRSSKGGGTYYNGIALALSPTNFETLWNLMTVTNAKNEDDTEVEIIPDYMLCSTALKFQAQRLLESTLIPGASTNDKNVLEGIVDLVATRYITDTDFFMLGVKNKGLIFYERETPEIDFWEDKRNKSYWMSIEEAYGVMVKNWRFFAASNFSTS